MSDGLPGVTEKPPPSRSAARGVCHIAFNQVFGDEVQVIQSVEIDPGAQSVLRCLRPQATHFPSTPIHADICVENNLEVCRMLKSLSLFSGIGGFELAAQQVGGFEIKQLVEIDPDACQVLKSHFPNIPIHNDIRTYEPSEKFDICWGGFPCTNTSCAGDRTGLVGSESSLWFEMLRIIATTKPRFVLMENPTGLINRGLRAVLGGFRMAGYSTEIEVIRASEIGAPHERKRLFVIAYPHGWSREEKQPPSWASQIGNQVAIARSNSCFPTVKRRNDGVAYGFPEELDNVPVCVPKGTTGRIKSRYLYGRSVVPGCAAIAFHRIKFLDDWFT